LSRGYYRLQIRETWHLLPQNCGVELKSLALAYPEHLGAANRADPSGCRPAVLHGYRLGILYFSLGTALNTISLHMATSLLARQHKPFPEVMSIPFGPKIDDNPE
jgi:hypothetical protein